MEEKLRLFIADHPFFKDLSQSDRIIREVVKNTKIKKVEKYKIIKESDVPQSNLIFIMSGQVSIFIKKSKTEIDYDREQRLHFEEAKRNYEQAQQQESQNKMQFKKAEQKFKNAFKQVDNNERQYDDPLYRSAFQNFDSEYMSNKLVVFPLKRIQIVNAGYVIGQSELYYQQMQIQKQNNITAVSQTNAVIVLIPIDYLNTVIPFKKINIIQSSFEKYFGQTFQKDIYLISEFFQKQTYENEKTIFKYRENTDKIYLIGRGEIELSIYGNNRYHKFMTLQENDIFGHESFSFERSYKAVSLRSDTYVYSIEKQIFFELIENKILFSQISSIGDKKLKSYIQSTEQSIQTNNENMKDKQQEQTERVKKALYQYDSYKQNKFIQNQIGGRQKKLKNSLSFSIQDEMNYQNKNSFSRVLQDTSLGEIQKNRSYTNHSEDIQRQFIKTAIKNLPFKTPSQSTLQAENRIKQAENINESYEKIGIYENKLEISQIQDQKQECELTIQERHKKYIQGLSTLNKKDYATLPTISSSDNKPQRKNMKNRQLPTLDINEGILISQDKLNETSFMMDEISYLFNYQNKTGTSYGSKDTQINLQKNLIIQQSLQDELSKQFTQQSSNPAFLQDLAQKEQFSDLQEKVKSSIYRKNKKCISPSQTKYRDSSEYIIHSKLKKMKSRHHSIESIDTRQVYKSLKSKNFQTVLPLDIYFRKEREKYRQEKKIREQNKQPITELKLNITDQMRAITPLLDNTNEDQIDFKNEVLRKISSTYKKKDQQFYENMKNKQKIAPSDSMLNETKQNTSSDIIRVDSSLGSYNIVKLQKKNQQRKQQQKRDQDQHRYSQDSKLIDYEGIQLKSKTIPIKEYNVKNYNKKINIQNEQKNIQENDYEEINKQSKSLVVNPSQQINGEQNIKQEKVQSLVSQSCRIQKPFQILSQNKQDIRKYQNTQENQQPMQKIQPKTVQTLISFKNNNNSSQILNQFTNSSIENVNKHERQQNQFQQKNRSITIEDMMESNQKLNTLETLDQSQFYKYNKNSQSPDLRAQKGALHTESSILELSLMNQEDSIIIHQNKKKYSNLPDILKHKAYIQKKVKRKYIKMPQTNYKFDLDYFSKNLKMYSDIYNHELICKQLQIPPLGNNNINNQSQKKINDYTDIQILSLNNQHPQLSEQKQYEKQIKKYSESCILQPQLINISEQNKDSQLQKEQIQQSQNVGQNEILNQISSQSNEKESYLNPTSSQQRCGIGSITNHLNKSFQNFNNQTEQIDLKVQNNSLIKSISIERLNTTVCTSQIPNHTKPFKDYSVNQTDNDISIQNTTNTNKKISPNRKACNSACAYGKQNEKDCIKDFQNIIKYPSDVLIQSNSQCSFAFGQPIINPNNEQNQTFSTNKSQKSAQNSFYGKSHSSNMNNNVTESIKIKKDSVKEEGFPLINQQQTTNNQINPTLNANDLSHLNTIKQLEIQRQTNLIFSFQSFNSPNGG